MTLIEVFHNLADAKAKLSDDYSFDPKGLPAGAWIKCPTGHLPFWIHRAEQKLDCEGFYFCPECELIWTIPSTKARAMGTTIEAR